MKGMAVSLLAIILVSQLSLFVPMAHLRSGSFYLSGTEIRQVHIECDSGNYVEIQFNTSIAPIEFFLIHTDFYDENIPEVLPIVSLCEFHIIARSAEYQFTTARSGSWYLVFKNNPAFAETLQEQGVYYVWSDSSPNEVDMPLITAALVFGSIILGSIILIRFVRMQYIKRRSGAAGVI